MSYGPIKVFSTTIASGASTATLTLDKCYSRVFVDVTVSMSTAAAIAINESGDGTTYVPTYERVNTATMQYQAIAIATNIGASTGRAPVNISGPYIQFAASAVVSGGTVLKVICSD